MKKLLLILAGLSVCMVFSVTTYAATETTTLDFSVTVVPTCAVTATDINFITYDGSGDLGGVGEITVTCTALTNYNIALDAGLNFISGSRNLSDGAYDLHYDIFQSVDLSSEWGDSDFANTYPGGTSLSFIGSGSAYAHPIIGYLYGGQIAPAGVYTDTVTVTVHY
jgi:spore coat protein U-like protein